MHQHQKTVHNTHMQLLDKIPIKVTQDKNGTVTQCSRLITVKFSVAKSMIKQTVGLVTILILHTNMSTKNLSSQMATR